MLIFYPAPSLDSAIVGLIPRQLEKQAKAIVGSAKIKERR